MKMILLSSFICITNLSFSQIGNTGIVYLPKQLPPPKYILHGLFIDSTQYFSLKLSNDDISFIKYLGTKRAIKEYGSFGGTGLFIVKTNLLYSIDGVLFDNLKKSDIKVINESRNLKLKRISSLEFERIYEKFSNKDVIIIDWK